MKQHRLFYKNTMKWKKADTLACTCTHTAVYKVQDPQDLIAVWEIRVVITFA